MTSSEMRRKQMEAAAQAALRDVVFMIDNDGSRASADQLSGEQVVALLRKNWVRLDPDRDGITRAELLAALQAPQKFTRDEYALLYLLSKYFDVIIEMSDDEPGEQTRITRRDAAVMAQFLLHAKMNLSALDDWLKANEQKEKSFAALMPPPPMLD